MSLSADLETAKNELRSLDLLKVGQNATVLSERDTVLLGMLRLILSQLGSSSGGGGGGTGIDYEALADAIANKSFVVTDAIAPANKLGINASGQIGISNFPINQAVSIATLPALASGGNTIGSIANTEFASTQLGNWSVRNQDGSGNAITSQVNGSQRALDAGIVVGGTQVDPRAIRALTNADVVSAAQSGTWNISVANFPATQAVSIASLPALASGSNIIGSIANTGFASTQSGNWSVRNQDGSGNAITSQTNGSQRALDTGILVGGIQVDPRAIRALTNADVVSAAQSGTWNISVANFPATQAVSIASLPALATGSNIIGSIANTGFASTQSGNWSVRNQDGSGNAITSQANGSQRALDTGILVGGIQVDPRAIRALTNADVVSAVQSGTWNVNVLGAAPAGVSTTVAFASSVSSATFSISNKFAIAVIPAIASAPTITLQVSLDGGTTWADSSINIVSSSTTLTLIESDSFARIVGTIGLASSLRFKSSASITTTIALRHTFA